MAQEVECARAFAPLYTPARYKVYYGGRGGAKSWHFADALLTEGYHKPLRVLCTREFQSSIKESVHFLLQQQIEKLGLSAFYDVEVQAISGANGTKFWFEGLHRNVDRIKSMEAIDRCWVEEADKVSESSWDFLIPTIRKDGSEIWVSFNPRFKYDSTSQRFIFHPPPAEVDGRRYSVIQQVSWRDNPWFPDVLRTEMEQLKAQDYEKYLHVWEGEFKQIAEGAIFGKQITQAKRDNRICAIPIERNVACDTSWDLGKNDATAIWFWQRVGKEYRAIGYYENRGMEIDHYCEVVRKFAKEHNIEYGKHYMPHDVEADMLGMPQSRAHQFKQGGVKPIVVVPRVKAKNSAIEAGRKLFPYCWFDKERCEKGLDVLSNYHYEYDEDKDSYKLAPMHDWASNGADAFMQMAQAMPNDRRPGPSPQPVIHVY